MKNSEKKGTICLCSQEGEIAVCNKFGYKITRKSILKKWNSIYRLKKINYVLQVTFDDEEKPQHKGKIRISLEDKVIVEKRYESLEQRESIIEYWNRNVEIKLIEITPDI